MTSEVSREQVAEALKALAEAVRWGQDGEEKFLSVSRRLKTFDQVSADQQPCCYSVESNENLSKRTRQPRVLVQSFMWVIYHSVGADPEATPGATNNAIMDAVEIALAPKPGDPGFLDERNTLGGLVHHVWIDGEVIKDPGDLDKQGLLVVPIKVKIP